MNLVELDHALRKLRLSGMATVLEAGLRQAHSEKMAPIDLVSTLVGDELIRRQDRRADKDGSRTLTGLDTGQPSGGSIFSGHFDEEPQVRLAGFRAERGRPIAVDEREQPRAAELIAATLEEVLHAAADPEVMRARGVSR